MRSSAIILISLLSGCSLPFPGEKKSQDTVNADGDAAPEAPALAIDEAAAEDFSVRPGTRSAQFYEITFSSGEDVEITSMMVYVNKDTGRNLTVGDAALAGTLKLELDGRTIYETDASSISPFGNPERCEVTDGLVTKGPCGFSRFSEYARQLDPIIEVSAWQPKTVTVTSDISWRARNGDGYKFYIRAVVYRRKGTTDEYMSILLGYHGPAISVSDTTSFCGSSALGIYGFEGCCDSQGFQPQTGQLRPGTLVSVPFLKQVLIATEDGGLARFPSSRELASWFGRRAADGLIELGDHAACNLVGAVSVTDLLNMPAARSVGLLPGEFVVRTWTDERTFLIENGHARKEVSLQVAAAIFPGTLDDRILYLEDDEIGTYPVIGTVQDASEYDAAAISAAAAMEDALTP